MELLRRVVEYGGKTVELYETKRGEEKFSGTLRECLLFFMGYGTDQAAELRYEMARYREEIKKTADGL